jgi:hypothetical protein
VTDRHTVDSLTSDMLDELHDDRDRLARLRTRVQSAADEARGSMRDWLIDALADAADPREPSTAQTFREQAARAEAANTRVRNLAARIRQGVPWTANDDDIADHILAALDGQAPAASCSPDGTETEPNNPRTTPDNPATSSDWTPPPPGDRREQLPPAILALIDPPPYTSTACHTAGLLTWQPRARTHPDAGQHIDRLHARCQASHEFTGAACDCPCHRLTAAPADAAPPAETAVDDLTGAWTPDPPIRCLNLGQPKEG